MNKNKTSSPRSSPSTTVIKLDVKCVFFFYEPATAIQCCLTGFHATAADKQGIPGSFGETGGLSNAGSIAGDYCSSTSCALFNSVGHLHGFLWSGGAYTTFDYPSATETLAFGVNSANEIVGGYEDANGVFHGYLRTP